MAKKATSKEAPAAAQEKKSAKKTAKNTVSEESTPLNSSLSEKAATAIPDEPEQASAKTEVLDEHIQVAAYFRWVDRGMPFGTPEEDWNEAEKQFRE